MCAYYREAGAVHAERRALRGALDAGDVAGVPGVADSCKDCREWRLNEWLDELQAMIRNAGATVGAIWLKRRRKVSPGDAYVIMRGATYVRLLREAGYLPPENSSVDLEAADG